MKKSPVGHTEQSERQFRWNKQYVRRHQGLAWQLSHKLSKIWSESILVSGRKPHAHYAGVKLCCISLRWSTFCCKIHRRLSLRSGCIGYPIFCICRLINWKRINETALSICDDEKAIWQSFILRYPHYSSAGEKQFICFTAAACWQKERFICFTPGLCCSEQRNAKWKSCCFFLRQRRTR